MNVHEIERIQATTRDFHDLQGLKTLVPWGLANCGMGILWIGIDYVRNLLVRFLVINVVGMGLLVGALLLYLRTDAYYRRTFGDVAERPRWSLRRSIWIVVLASALCLMLFMVAPVRAPSIFWGSLLIAGWLLRGHRLALLHQLLLGALLLGLAAPSASTALGLAKPSGSGVACILSGLAWILAGLLDHLQLVRQMRPPGAPPSAVEPSSLLQVER